MSTDDITPPLERVQELATEIATEASSDDPALGEIDWSLQAAREELAAAAERRLDR